MTDSLAGFVWFAPPERLLILCIEISYWSGWFCKNNQLTPWTARSHVSVFMEESTGKKSLPSETQRTWSTHHNMNRKRWIRKMKNEEKKKNTNIKIREFLFEDFCNRITIESYADGPRRSAIQDDLAWTNQLKIVQFSQILISPLGALERWMMQVSLEMVNFWATQMWFWMVTCSKLFARDTISSAIACVQII